jgi:hypothetical protein
MPHYHFHLLHGRPVRDLEGEALPDEAAARRHALRVMGEILRDGRSDFWEAGSFSLVCTDGNGAVVTGLHAQQMSADLARQMLARIDHDEGV